MVDARGSALGRVATIADVAARAGVSKGSVSFVFNGRPGIAEATKDRILQAARDLGYTPSRAARALSLRRAGAVGLVLNRPHDVLRADPFFPPFMAGVESVIAPRGSSIVLRLVTPQEESTVYRELAAAGQIDGAVLTDLRVDDPRPALLRRLGLPFVTLNRPEVASTGTAVCTDDRAGIRAAVESLVALGHQRIGHVAGPDIYLHARSRRDAWREVLAENGLSSALVVDSDFSAAGGAAATDALLDDDEPPTAIVYASDLMALAGMSAAIRRGLRIPEDLSVVGFDDTDIAAHLHPPLASVRTDAFEWGAAVGAALLDAIAGTERTDVELPAAHYIQRPSVGPVPTSP